MLNPRKIERELDAARVARGERLWPRSFADRLTTELPSTQDVARMIREGGTRVRDLGAARDIPVRTGAPLPTTGTGVTWVGHATYLVRIGGLTVLTDPVWSRRIPGVRPRLTAPGVAWSALPPIDAVVISHNHYDHLDAPTIRRLPRHTRILAPAGLAGWFRQRGFRDVTDLDWWESVDLGGDVEAAFVPAHHWSRRGLLDTCRSLWGGWVLTGPAGERVYFAGDTGYGPFFDRIAQRYRGIDLALLPVGAYEPNWFMKPVHLNPEEAVRACLELGARRMAPMHWGTFVLSAEPLLDPLRRTRTAWEQAGRPRADLWDLAIGESRML